MLAVMTFVMATWATTSPARQREELDGLYPDPELRMEVYEGDPSEEVQQAVRALLAEPLTPDAAVQVAVLNSRRIQTLFQELGVARADLRQGRLLPNPELEANTRAPGSDDARRASEFTLLFDINRLLLYPSRRGLASAQYEQAKMQAADDLLAEISRVKAAYFRLQSLLQTSTLLEGILRSAEAGAELAMRQRTAGNINALQEAGHLALMHDARVRSFASTAALQTRREDLGRLLGLDGSSPEWTLPAALPALPAAEPPLEEITAAALSRRSDLAAARQQIRTFDRALTITRWQFIPSFRLGPSFERDIEGRTLSGAEVHVELPVFDRQQAAGARLKSQREKSRHRVRILEADVGSQVRSAFNRMTAARSTAAYLEDTVIPLRVRVVSDSQLHYNFMLAGPYQLLQAKRDELAARLDHIEALEDYWMSRTELERAVGAPLSAVRGQE